MGLTAPATWVVTCTPDTGDADSRGACPPNSPPASTPPCLRAASKRLAGDWFWLGGRNRAGAGAWGSPRAGRWEALGEQGLRSISPVLQAQILGET